MDMNGERNANILACEEYLNTMKKNVLSLRKYLGITNDSKNTNEYLGFLIEEGKINEIKEYITVLHPEFVHLIEQPPSMKNLAQVCGYINIGSKNYLTNLNESENVYNNRDKIITHLLNLGKIDTYSGNLTKQDIKGYIDSIDSSSQNTINFTGSKNAYKDMKDKLTSQDSIFAANNAKTLTLRLDIFKHLTKNDDSAIFADQLTTRMNTIKEMKLGHLLDRVDVNDNNFDLYDNTDDEKSVFCNDENSQSRDKNGNLRFNKSNIQAIIAWSKKDENQDKNIISPIPDFEYNKTKSFKIKNWADIVEFAKNNPESRMAQFVIMMQLSHKNGLKMEPMDAFDFKKGQTFRNIIDKLSPTGIKEFRDAHIKESIPRKVSNLLLYFGGSRSMAMTTVTALTTALMGLSGSGVIALSISALPHLALIASLTILIATVVISGIQDRRDITMKGNNGIGKKPDIIQSLEHKKGYENNNNQDKVSSVKPTVDNGNIKLQTPYNDVYKRQKGTTLNNESKITTKSPRKEIPVDIQATR